MDMHFRMDMPLTSDADAKESPVRMVSCSLLRAFDRRLYNVASAAAASGGTMSIRPVFVASSRTSKYDEPDRRPITRRSQVFLSFGSYGGIVNVGAVVIVLIRSMMMLELVEALGCGD